MSEPKGFEILMPPTGNHRTNRRGVVFPVAKSERGNAVCPSCGSALKVGVSNYRTNDYKTWLEAVAWQLKSGTRGVDLSGRIRVYCWVYGGKGFAENRDLDNIQKCLGDALVEAGILEGDSVKCLTSWRIEYFDRTEHLRRLESNRPRRADDLKARCLIRLEPLLR